MSSSSRWRPGTPRSRWALYHQALPALGIKPGELFPAKCSRLHVALPRTGTGSAQASLAASHRRCWRSGKDTGPCAETQSEPSTTATSPHLLVHDPPAQALPRGVAHSPVISLLLCVTRAGVQGIPVLDSEKQGVRQGQAESRRAPHSATADASFVQRHPCANGTTAAVTRCA